MTEAERKLLIWCGIMLVRATPLTPAEADEIDELIAAVRIEANYGLKLNLQNRS